MFLVSRTELLRSYSGLLSHTTPAYIPALLRCTFPRYSGVHSRATPVHTPVLLQSTTGLDWTPLDLPFDRTRAWLDMGSSCHSPVTYVPISCHLYLLVPSLFPAHIYSHVTIRLIVLRFLLISLSNRGAHLIVSVYLIWHLISLRLHLVLNLWLICIYDRSQGQRTLLTCSSSMYLRVGSG